MKLDISSVTYRSGRPCPRRSSANPAVDFPKILGLAQSGQLDLASLITARIPLDYINDAFDAMKRDGDKLLDVLTMTGNAWNVIAIEFLSAAQGVDLRAPLKSSPRLEGARGALRLKVPFATADRLLALDIEEAAATVRRAEVQSLARGLLPSFR